MQLFKPLEAIELDLEKFRKPKPHPWTFWLVGEGLAEIKVGELYKKNGFQDFEEYVTKRWDSSIERVEEIIGSASVMFNLSIFFSKSNMPFCEELAESIFELAAFPENQASTWSAFLYIHAKHTYRCYPLDLTVPTGLNVSFYPEKSDLTKYFSCILCK